MKNLLYLIVFILGWASCSTVEESISFDSNLEVLFSNDSVIFDTLLSENRSSTRRLTVFNPNAEAVQFSSISLGWGDDSDYSLVINGRESNSLVNEKILGGDSMLILVEARISERNSNLPYLVRDSIIFEWNTNKAEVKLISYGQDGNRVGNAAICNEVWTNDRPYIVSDTLLVSPGCTLTIEKGTSVYFENDAVLFVQGTLLAVGDSAKHITFRNSRFDGIYDQVPGQWNGIYFLEGSKGNEVAFADIYNAQVGLRVGTPDDDAVPDITIANTQIFNMSVAGILAFTSDLEVTNTLIYNCGSYLVGNFAGGNYSYQHCTLVNEPSLFVQDAPTVQFSDNVLVGENEVITADLSVSLSNCIIWGSQEEELLINNGGGSVVSATLVTNIIKSRSSIEGNFISEEFNYPGFLDLFRFDYRLDTSAFARGKATPIGILTDLRGIERDSQPDIGAFELVVNE